MFDIEGEKGFRLRFTPNFSYRLGRIDFILLNRLDIKGNDFHGNTLTIAAILSDGYEPDPLPVIEGVTQPARSALGMVSSLDENEEGYTSYGSWLWHKNTDYSQSAASGELVRQLAGETELIMEAVCGDPGLYRTVLIFDETLLPPSAGTVCVDWESDGANTLLLHIDLTDVLTEAGSHTFFSIGVPLDDLYKYSEVSRKIEIRYEP